MIFIPVFVPIFLGFDPIRECLYVEEYVGIPCLRTELEIYFWNITSREKIYIDGDSFYLRDSGIYRVTSANITNLNCKTCAVEVCEEWQYLGRISVLDPSPAKINYTSGGALCDDPALRVGHQDSIPRYAFDSNIDNIGWNAFMVKLMIFAVFGIFCISCGRLFLLYLMSYKS